MDIQIWKSNILFIFITESNSNFLQIYFSPLFYQITLKRHQHIETYPQMIKQLILILTVICLSHCVNLVYYSQLPVSRLTLFKALLSMSYLKGDLDKTFGTIRQNKIAYYIRTKLTENYLNDVSAQLAQYNNVVIGANNLAAGQKNLLIGDNNSVLGSQNWIFSQGFNGVANKDLILDQWQIQVDKAPQILNDPKLAIKRW